MNKSLLSASAGPVSSAEKMAAPLPPQLEQLLAAVDSSINGVEVALEPYLSVPLKNLIAQMGPLDNARLNTSLAFCSSSLLFGEFRPLLTGSC